MRTPDIQCMVPALSREESTNWRDVTKARPYLGIRALYLVRIMVTATALAALHRVPCWGADLVFGGPTRLGVGRSPSAAIDSKTKMLCAVYLRDGALYFQRSTNQSAAWSEPMQIVASNAVGHPAVSAVAATVVVCWQDAKARQIKLIASADGGLTFSAPSVVVTAKEPVPFLSVAARGSDRFESALVSYIDGGCVICERRFGEREWKRQLLQAQNHQASDRYFHSSWVPYRSKNVETLGFYVQNREGDYHIIFTRPFEGGDWSRTTESPLEHPIDEMGPLQLVSERLGSISLGFAYVTSDGKIMEAYPLSSFPLSLHNYSIEGERPTDVPQGETKALIGYASDRQNTRLFAWAASAVGKQPAIYVLYRRAAR